MAILDEILRFNSQRGQGRPERIAAHRLCVVTCCEAGMLGMLESALGIGDVEPTVITSAGPVVAAGGELLRAVALAVLLGDCDEILVVAHAGCKLVTTNASEAASALSRRGVERDAIEVDLRSFFGLSASPRQLAIDAATTIRDQPWIPADVTVHAVVLDGSGGLEIAERGENVTTAQTLRRRSDSRAPIDFDSALPAGLGVGLAAGSMLDSARGPRGSSGPVNVEFTQIKTAPLDTSGFEMTQTVLTATELDFGPSIKIDIEPVAPHRILPTESTAMEGVGGSLPPAPPTPRLPRPPPRRGQTTAERAPVASSRAPLTAGRAPLSAERAPLSARRGPLSSGTGNAGREPALSPQLVQALEKVRVFYRGEIGTGPRTEVSRQLSDSFGTGEPTSELVRIAFKPVLEAGPKRYKVIDDLLVIKEAVTGMERDGAFAALRQLVD